MKWIYNFVNNLQKSTFRVKPNERKFMSCVSDSPFDFTPTRQKLSNKKNLDEVDLNQCSGLLGFTEWGVHSVDDDGLVSETGHAH